MPFKSMAQEKAAFAGGLGPKMQAAAPQWAAETPNPKKLPDHVVRTALVKKLFTKRKPF